MAPVPALLFVSVGAWEYRELGDKAPSMTDPIGDSRESVGFTSSSLLVRVKARDQDAWAAGAVSDARSSISGCGQTTCNRPTPTMSSKRYSGPWPRESATSTKTGPVTVPRLAAHDRPQQAGRPLPPKGGQPWRLGAQKPISGSSRSRNRVARARVR